MDNAPAITSAWAQVAADKDSPGPPLHAKRRPMTSSYRPTLTGKRVLIVEDEPLIAMQLEEMLGEFGCLCATAANVADGLEVLQKISFNAAFVDVNLNGAPSLPIAEVLRERGTPFVFVSGYGASEVPSEHAAAPLITKPFTEAEMIRCLRLMALA